MTKMTNIQYLLSIGIEIPKGAIYFRIEENCAVFVVADRKGIWYAEHVDLTDAQVESLRTAGRLGTLGCGLEVGRAGYGYRANSNSYEN